MKKRLLCFLLCISMILPNLPMEVWAEEASTCEHIGGEGSVSQNSVCEFCETEEEETEKEQQPEEKEKKFQNDSGEVSQNDVLKKEEEKSQIVEEEQEENSSSTGDSAGNLEYKEDEQASLSQNSQPSVSGNGSDHGDDLQNTDQEIREEVITLTIEHKGLGSVYDVIPRRMGFFSLRPGNSWDSTSNTYYGQLDDESKAVYDILKAAYQNGGKAEAVSLNLDQELTDVPEGGMTQAYQDQKMSEVANIVNYALLALIYDHPEISWLVNTGGGTSVGFSSRTLGNTTTYHMTNVVYTMGNGSNTQFTKGQLDKAVADAMTEINTSLQQTSNTTYDKVKVIHDYICNNVSYVPPGQSLDDDKYQTVHSALVDNTGGTVCTGYAKAFKVLCDKYAIPCILVSGTGTNSSGESEAHMWNYVQVDGSWYAVDCTWDDQNAIYYDYFLSGSDTLASTGFGGASFSYSHVASGKWSEELTSEFKYPNLNSNKYPSSPASNVSGEEIVYVKGGKVEIGAGTSDDPYNSLTLALQRVKENGIIQIEGSVSTSQEDSDVPLIISKKVTITGGEITNKNAGIVLGADVGFKDIKLNYTSPVRNVIIANGHTLTLENVQSTGTYNISIFAGEITERQNLYPDAGAEGEIILKGSVKLGGGDIYAGNFSDLGATKVNGVSMPNTETVESNFSGNVKIVVQGSNGDIDNIYCYGAREYREGNLYNAMWTDDNNPEHLSNIKDYYGINGKIIIELYGSEIKVVSGASDRKAHVVVNSDANGSLVSGIAYENINTLEVNCGVEPGKLTNGTNIILNSGGELDLTSVMENNAFTVGKFTGALSGIPGKLAMSQNNTLTITGAIAGVIEFQTLEQRPISKITSGHIKDEHIYIIGVSSMNGSEFTFVPEENTQRNASLIYHDGRWVGALDGELNGNGLENFSIDSTYESLTISKTDINGNGLKIPVNCGFADPNAFDAALELYPLKISVNKGLFDYNGINIGGDSYYEYCINSLSMAIGGSTSQDDFSNSISIRKCIHDSAHTQIASGIYTITIKAETVSGSTITETITLTVTDEQPGTTTKTQLSQGSLSLKSGVSYTYDGTAKTPSLSQLNLSVNGTSVSLDSNNFDISYSNNTNAGTATVTVTAKDTNTVYEGSVSGTFAIGKKSVTIKAKNQAIRKGNSIVAQVSQVESVTGLVSGDQLQGITLAGNESTKKITPSAAVIKNGNIDKTANYNITYQTGTLTIIDPKITITVANNIVYDGAELTAGLSSGNFDVTYSLTECANPQIQWYQNGTVLSGAPKNAGTYTVKVSATPNTVGGTVEAEKTVVINKVPLTAQVNSKTLTYGQSFSLAGNNVTYSGFKGNDTANTALSGGTINFSTTYRQYQDVGTYTLTADVSQITSANYNITVKPGTLTVTALPVTLSWNNITGRTYNDGKKVTASVTNLVNGDQVQVTVTGGDAAGVGTHTATASALTGAKAKNYTLSGVTKTQSYQIAKAAAPSNVAVERNVKWSQGGNQTFAASDFSLPADIKNAKITKVQKNSETVDSQNIFSGTAVVTNGTVTIPIAKAVNFVEGNKGIYDVTITSDTHEDIQGEITIIIVDKEVVDSLISLTVENITYGELPSPKGSFSGTKGNHILEEYTYSKDGIHYKTLDELKNVSGWLDAGDYDVHYTYSDDGQIGTKIAAFKVGKKELTSTFDVNSIKKEYDGTTMIASGQNPVLIVKGAVSGENPTINSDGILFSYENSMAGTDKVIKATGITLAEGNGINQNYLIADSASATGAIITPKTIMVSPKTSYSKQYGTKDPVLEYTVVGLLDSDVLEGTLKRAIGENVGSFSYDVSSLKNSNYTVKLDDQASYFTITKAEADIFVSADVVNQKPGSKVAVTVVAKNKKALEIAGATQPKSVVVDGVIFKAKEDGVFEGDYTVPSTAKAGDTITLKAKINDSNYLSDKEAAVTITVSERETTALPVPGELDGKSYRLAMEQGISKVPDALKNHDTFNTVDKILNALKVEVKKQDGKITDGNTVTYDVILWYSNDNGKSWIKADATHWPKEGTITVILPYPAGTSKNTHNFKVTHMFTVNMNGKQAGTFEYPIPVKTDQGIEFKVSGLSPITLGWSQIETTSQENQGGGSQGGNSQGGESSTTAAQTKKENKTEEKPVEVNKQNATESSGTKRTPAKQSGSKTNKVEVREEPQTQVAKAEEEKETGSVNEEALTEASGEKESEGVEEAAEETEEAASAVEVKEKSSIGIWIALAIAVIAAAGILILVIKRKQEDTE